MSKTMLINSINPEVMGDMVTTNLTSKIKFTPLCRVDSTLAGTAGDTITLPKYAFIGEATQVAEGTAIPIDALTASTEKVTVKKAGKGVEITDETLLSGYGDPVGIATEQITLAIASKVDTDVLTALAGIKEEMTHTATTAISADVIADALVKFSDEVDGEKVLLIAPAQLAALRKSESWIKATDMGITVLMKGTVGMIHGCQVVLSNKIKLVSTNYTNYIVKPEALAVYLKRDTMVESARDIVNKTTIITADKHYAVHIADDSKAIKLITK